MVCMLAISNTVIDHISTGRSTQGVAQPAEVMQREDARASTRELRRNQRSTEETAFALKDILVDIEDLHFQQDGRPVLADQHEDPARQGGRHHGRVGCGKTTLLRCIRLQADRRHGAPRGPARQRDAVPELYGLRRKMGMLFQFGAPSHRHDLFDNVAFRCAATDLPEEMIRDLVLMKLRPSACAARARADAGRTREAWRAGWRCPRWRSTRMLVMYDEPFAGLDPIALGVIGQLIRKLNDALGATSIMVTHDVHESLMIVDYIYFVSQGRIVAEANAG